MLMTYVRQISFPQHLLIALVIRFLLVCYSEIHDQNAEVLYTDVDYEVVTDGARHILENNSPFRRHTFRYSPLLALILTPNIFLHKSFGKLLFSIFDILVGVLICAIVKEEILTTINETLKEFYNNLYQVKHFSRQSKVSLPQRYIVLAKNSALFWLYNPLSMSISSRGNGDSFSCFFVLATIYFLQKNQLTVKHSFIAGLCHGVAIHLRLYPIVFSLAYFLSISESRHIFKDLLRFKFSRKQWALVIGTILSLTTLTSTFYYLYGYEYIYEAYLYHFIRKDTRHNFSLFFLTQYLNINFEISILEKLLLSLPQIVVLAVVTLTLGKDRRSLSFCVFVQTFIVVAYNSVVTSQYFIWYLAIFPICLKNLSSMPKLLGFVYFFLWILAQALWLLPAYLLEFKSMNTFNFIGVLGVAFFFLKIYLIQRLIKYFDVITRIKTG